MSVIECHALTKRYRGRAVVEDLDLAIEAGEIFGFLGPNGAGKTTTIRMLLGLCRPTSGSARLLGEACPPPAHVLARVGAMVEEPAFYPWMDPRRYLDVIADCGPGRVTRARRDDVIERVGLSDATTKKTKRFSQGMRQRLGLAAALLREPSVLLLDEPANGLDPAGIRWLRELLGELAAGGTTVLFSSHQLGEVERVCDRVGIVDKGRMIQVGPIESVGAVNNRVRVVVSSGEHDAALSALSRFNVSDGQAGVLTITDAVGRDIARALAEQQIFPDEIVNEESSLEQRFLELTGAAK